MPQKLPTDFAWTERSFGAGCSGRLRAQRVGRHYRIADHDLRAAEDALFPMAELPDEWKIDDDGSPAPNWIATLHRSRRVTVA